MTTVDEITSLIRRLREPEQRELAAWLIESLDDRWRVAEAGAPVVLASLEQTLELKSIDLALSLQQIYAALP